VNLLDCPVFQLDQAGGEDAAVGAPVAAAIPNEVYEPEIGLQSAEALTISEAAVVLSAAPTAVIVALGHTDVGKTTLLSVLYEQAASNRLSDWTLAKCRSVFGFERRCHDASVRSGRFEPVTPHTPRDPDDLFLHLELRRRTTGARCPLLLADVSGEDVEHIGRADIPDQLATVLRRADRLMVLIDGKGVADASRRENEIRMATDLLRVLSGNEVVSGDTPIDIVVTKADLLAGDLDENAAIDRISEAAQIWFGDVKVLQVAARPGLGSPLEQGHGFDDLVSEATIPLRQLVVSSWPDRTLDDWSVNRLVIRFWPKGSVT
jgi:hypothetical protein